MIKCFRGFRLSGLGKSLDNGIDGKLHFLNFYIEYKEKHKNLKP